jgi:hypothetical protein
MPEILRQFDVSPVDAPPPTWETLADRLESGDYPEALAPALRDKLEEVGIHTVDPSSPGAKVVNEGVQYAIEVAEEVALEEGGDPTIGAINRELTQRAETSVAEEIPESVVPSTELSAALIVGGQEDMAVPDNPIELIVGDKLVDPPAITKVVAELVDAGASDLAATIARRVDGALAEKDERQRPREVETEPEPTALRVNLDHWEYDQDGELQLTTIGSITIAKQASELQKQIEPLDKDLALQVASAANDRHDGNQANRLAYEQDLEQISTILQTPDHPKHLEDVAAKLRASAASLSASQEIKPSDYSDSRVIDELAAREKAVLEKQIAARIEADRLPWTMPDPQLAPDIMNTIQSYYEQIIVEQFVASPDDQFRVPFPMEPFENGQPYAAEDARLLAAAGIDLQQTDMHFTRAELKQANVFFVNRVGGGEQPIFGVPIPDPGSEDGLFHVEDRSFLTRAEFEKVYDYQQQQGDGIGDRDPLDVQTDMLLFTLRPETRRTDVPTRKTIGSGRENKYSLMRSPFVDSGFFVKISTETDLYQEESGMTRLNSLNIHLVHAHPEFPGVSETYDKRNVADDQKYMSAGTFVAEYYMPPPTAQEALESMRHQLPTARERAWVSAWPA